MSTRSSFARTSNSSRRTGADASTPLNPEGAEIAERKHGLIRTDEPKGITRFNREVPGSIAVHCLRVCEGHQAYLLVSNPGEIKRLTDLNISKWCFVDEGVLGYVYKKPQSGETMKLVRYSKNGDWRVARENRPDRRGLPRGEGLSRAPGGRAPRSPRPAHTPART